MATASRTSERRAIQRLHAAALTARGEHYRAERLLDCVLQDERKEATGYRTWSCEHRNCLFCGWKYSKSFIQRYGLRSENLMANGYRLSFLTLTIPNVLWLTPELYNWLPACFKKLMRRDPFRGRVVGAIIVTETDFNSDSQDFHVHIHGILSYQQCPPKEEIEEAWCDLTALPPDGVPPLESPERIVWINKIEQDSIKKTVGYLFKFKPIEDAEAFAEYVCVVENIRLVHSYGVLRKRR